MSVDFLVCKNCGSTFCDCGEYVSCECGEHWCDTECAEGDGYKTNHCKLDKSIDEGYVEEECELADDGRCCECEHFVETSCSYCRGENYDDWTLLNKALELLKMTREDLIKEINK